MKEPPGTSTTSDTANRLGSTLFLMALAHGVVILGITFTGGAGDPLSASTLKVTLVAPTQADAPESAEFMANQSVTGSGRPIDAPRPTAALSTFDLANLDGDARAMDLRDATPLTRQQLAEQLVTSGRSATETMAEPATDAAESVRSERATEMQQRDSEQSLAAILDVDSALPASEDDGPRGPSTLQSILADYLNAWRQRVERIGTLNFPREFLVGNTATRRPRLEVAIGPDGSLRDIIVQDSSGDRAVDQAAVTILRLAAPFDPLPAEILAEYEMLRFAYEWDFIQANR